MMHILTLFYGFLFFATVEYADADGCNGTAQYEPKVVCFISASKPHFSYDRLGPNLCTHYILIDLMIVNCQSSISLVEQSIPALSTFLEFKDRVRASDDTAKFILAVGGSNQESMNFSQAIAVEDYLVAFVEDIVDFVERHDLDGVDITWLNPIEDGDPKANRINLVKLLRQLRLRMVTGASLSLTVALYPEWFDIRSIDVYVDFVNLLTVDYHNPRKPSHVAPLFSKDPEDPSSIFRSVQAFVRSGLNPQKVVILTSTHGYIYMLEFSCAEGQVIVKNVEKLNKYEVQNVLEEDKFYISWDDTRQVPYGTFTQGMLEKKWLTFSDLESHRLKAKFVLKHQLGGIGAFTIDQEDDNDNSDGCHPGFPFPYLWTLVDTVRPLMKSKTLPLLMNGDLSIQYVSSKQTIEAKLNNAVVQT